jgi:glutamine synthetase
MLPEHLGEAIDYFVKDPVITDALGSYLTKNLVQIKTKEFADYSEHTGKSWAESRPEITLWEIDRYLIRC